MTQGVGIEQVIDINAEISGGGLSPADFGTGLMFTKYAGGNDETNVSFLSSNGENKIKRFRDLSEVTDVFSPDDSTVGSVYRDAEVWFASNRLPKPLYIAKVNTTSTPTKVWSTKLTPSQINQLKSGAVQWGVEINGTVLEWTNSGSNGAAITIDAAITSFQNEINASTHEDQPGFSGAKVEWDAENSRLSIEFGRTGSHPNFYGKPRFASSNPTSPRLDFLNTVKFDDLIESTPEIRGSDGVAFYQQGAESSETISDALTKVSAYASGGHPTALFLASDLKSYKVNNVDANRMFVTAIKSSDYIGAVTEKPSISIGSSFDLGDSSIIKDAEGQPNVIVISSDDSDPNTSNRRVDIALLSKLSSQDFSKSDSIITVVPKPLDGVEITKEITKRQIGVLEENNASVYVGVGGYPTFLGGKTGSGNWIDAQWWLSWLKSELETELFTAIRSSKRLKNIELTDTIHRVMAKAKRTGGIQLGGQLNNTLTNEVRRFTENSSFNGLLQNGYLLWIQRAQVATSSDKAARHANFKVWISPSEAIHSVSGGIVLNG